MITTTHLFQEIHEQPAVLGRFLRQQRQPLENLAVEIKARKITHVVIAARGTSDNAGRYAQYLLGARNGLVVALAAPSLFSIYKQPPTFQGALVLAISQSGKSPDIVAVLSEARRQGALTAVITNNPDSDLAKVGEHIVDLGAGEEKAVAATKTYTAELAAIGLLSAILADNQAMLSEVDQVETAVAATLSMNDQINRLAARYRYMTHCVVIGRGYNYATAFETALKMKELTYSIVEAYSSADFLHGPMAVIEAGFPVIIIAPSGMMLPEMDKFLSILNEKKAETIVISDNENVLSQARIALQLPTALPEWLSPLTSIVPGQILSMHLAHARDLNVDSPRGLHKVTETH